MGTFFHPITIIGPAGQETLEVLVDTGASFTTMPASVLHRLGVTPFRRARLKLADGQVADWDLGRVSARIDGLEDQTICIFGPEGSPPVIGSHTLQGMLLAVDQSRRRLVPREGFLLTTAANLPSPAQGREPALSGSGGHGEDTKGAGGEGQP